MIVLRDDCHMCPVACAQTAREQLGSEVLVKSKCYAIRVTDYESLVVEAAPTHSPPTLRLIIRTEVCYK